MQYRSGKTVVVFLGLGLCTSCLGRSSWSERRELQLSDCWPHCEGQSDSRTGGDGGQGDGGGGRTGGQGAGVIGDPWVICTEAELRALATREGALTAVIALGDDIDLRQTTEPLTPIGTTTEPFQGVFDGQGHSIVGMTLVGNADTTSLGLFGTLQGAVVQNLVLQEPTVTASTGNVGTLAGVVNDGILAHITVTGSAPLQVTTTTAGTAIAVGGMVGSFDSSLASDCQTSVAIVGSEGCCRYVGGFAGQMTVSFVQRTLSTGDVSAPGSTEVGGMVGYCWSSLSEFESVNVAFSETGATGNVYGGTNVGGFGGYLNGFCRISDSYASGAVNGVAYVGGFAGLVASLPSFTDTFAHQHVTGGLWTGRFAGSYVTSHEDYVIGTFVSSELDPALPILGEGTVAPELFAISESQFADDSVFRNANWAFGGTWFRESETSPTPSLAAHGDPCARDLGATSHRALGNGTASDPFRLCTVAQLVSLSLPSSAGDWNKVYVLHRDLDLSGIDWQPIGNLSTPFTGTFEGRHHRLSNLQVTRTDVTEAGLFGVVGSGGIVHGLQLVAPLVRGPYRLAGALAGQVSGIVASIAILNANSPDTGVETTTSLAEAVGGAIGEVLAGTYPSGSYLYAETRVRANVGDAAAGGAVGRISAVSIIGTVAVLGTVESSGGPAGGIVGTATDTGIGGASFRGNVVGGADSGGIVGRASHCSIFFAAAWGTATGTAAVGGAIGSSINNQTTSLLVGMRTSGGSKVAHLVGDNDATSVLSKAACLLDANPGVDSVCGTTPCPTIACFDYAAFTAPASYESWTDASGSPFESRSPRSFVLLPGALPWLRWERDHCLMP